MTDTEKLALGTLIFGGFIAYAAQPALPRLTMQHNGWSPFPPGWADVLRRARFDALSIKLGSSGTIKNSAAIGRLLDEGSAVGLARHGAWWVVSRTHADAERDAAKMAEACQQYGCTALHLNAEKSFWGNRESGSGGPCPDVSGRMRLLIGQLRALAPGVELWWNGYHSASFTNAAGEKQVGIGLAEIELCDWFEPMCYIFDKTSGATSTYWHKTQQARWQKLRAKFPGVPISPMVFQGNWDPKKYQAWLGTNRAAGGYPGLAGLVAELRPEGVSFWRWTSSHTSIPDQLVQDTAAAPRMEVLGPLLHDAWAQGTTYVG